MIKTSVNVSANCDKITRKQFPAGIAWQVKIKGYEHEKESITGYIDCIAVDHIISAGGHGGCINGRLT